MRTGERSIFKGKRRELMERGKKKQNLKPRTRTGKDGNCRRNWNYKDKCLKITKITKINVYPNYN